MTFPLVGFLKLCNCMISQGECLTWCDRQTALGPENRDWRKKQANPCDLFSSFAPASPLCWDNSGSLSLWTLASPTWKWVHIPCSTTLLEGNQWAFWPVPHVPHLFPCLPVFADCLRLCTHILFLSPSAISTAVHRLDSLFRDLLQTGRAPVRLPRRSLYRAEDRTSTALSEWEEGHGCKSPGEADWHHELALSLD